MNVPIMPEFIHIKPISTPRGNGYIAHVDNYLPRTGKLHDAFRARCSRFLETGKWRKYGR